ncbi:histidine ammonia-lyase [Ensifer sp. ENS06]|uniref:HAL/PAL/TAL family ammonia-lyase n=1 Tax=Ensifer sp. ENS06 TaxID=2769276 RepID=UPI00177EDEDA|nr:histidine ammonia-lyase [Ensifer sp. ENS06]MBD9628134.1 histidine ammonia-lyase [Ensifer sp. ENS06]
MTTIIIDQPLSWRDIAAVSEGAGLTLSDAARDRIANARTLVEAIVEKNIRGYGINTGVGALCDVIIDRTQQQKLSRNIVMSHACGVGDPLGRVETRSIMAAMVNTYAHGRSGVRVEVVELLCAMLKHDCIPVVRSRGSVGYLAHAACIALVMIGCGHALLGGEKVGGAEALALIGHEPLVLQAKEGLSLVNGTACATGLACVGLARMARLADWGDVAAAMSYENLGNQAGTFDDETLSMRQSTGLLEVGGTLRSLLAGSPLLAKIAGRRTQDPLSLRAVPQIHGAVRDNFSHVADVVDRELASVTDNPAVSGTAAAPAVHSQAHAVGAAIALAMDNLAVAASLLGAVSERRIDRLVNPLVSGLPAFLTADSGTCTGFQVVQCTAASLAADNRRLAAPASLDGGITAALQEDILTHATPASLKLLTILRNVEEILAIELLSAAQAYDLQSRLMHSATATTAVWRQIRERVPTYADDRPISDDIDAMRALMSGCVRAVREEQPGGR